ncbi:MULTISPECIES: MalY/PatB family protein [Caproicibacterium]|uniref:cysteine-S-conjugate beta-lyase n=1 Tax=Caproicibacterium argilliputei TaxID=3030016 RepID=A0AA97D9A9_9FIRM|nr:MalY/PatB family protein [Caproicibacterium argilliputei]WOC32621.1 MalY/PatB family protein [Caproicibacterium argilliputei]
MRYDFSSKVERRNTGSYKWDEMYRKKPDVSPDTIPFSVADMELMNPPEIIMGLQSFLDSAVLGYTGMTPAYRQAVVSWMKRHHGWEPQESWMVTSPGVVPAFFNAVRAFTEPGDGVILMPPVYYPFLGAIEKNGRTAVENPLLLQGSRYTIDFADLERKARDPKNKLLLFCSPHNPVGRVWSKEELCRVAEICLANHVFVVSDEIHSDLLLPGVEHTVFATLSEEAAQNCIVCTAPSKTFNLAGMQTSNIFIPNAERRKRFEQEFAKAAMGGVGILGLKACQIAYTECDEWLRQLCELLQQNHELVRDFMAQNLPQVKVFPLEGTYLQWMDFRGLGMDYRELETFMQQKAEWFLDEGYVFGKEGRGFERLNLACPTAVLQEALERLLDALQNA